MNKKIIIGILVICLLAFVAVIAFAQTSSNVRWEYRWSSGNTNVLNELGAQGWKVVAIDTNLFQSNSNFALLKRRQ